MPGTGGFNWRRWRRSYRGPDLVAITHASNAGSGLSAGGNCRQARREGALVCVDLSQTAGVLPINLEEMELILPPPGIRACWDLRGGRPHIREESICAPVSRGLGPTQRLPSTLHLPDHLKVGPELPGIAGLPPVSPIWKSRERTRCWPMNWPCGRGSGRAGGVGAIIYGDNGPSVGLLFNLPGLDSTELAYILDDNAEYACGWPPLLPGPPSPGHCENRNGIALAV